MIDKNKTYISNIDGNTRLLHYWKIKKLTDTTLKLERIKKDSAGDGIGIDFNEITCKFDNQCVHNLRDWKDGTFTIYPNRSGVPYYFYPNDRD